MLTFYVAQIRGAAGGEGLLRRRSRPRDRGKPTSRDEVVNVAFPLPSSVTGDICVPSSVNITPPAERAAGGSHMLPVNVTDWPNVDGFSEDEIVVDVVILLTVCVSGAEIAFVEARVGRVVGGNGVRAGAERRRGKRCVAVCVNRNRRGRLRLHRW